MKWVIFKFHGTSFDQLSNPVILELNILVPGVKDYLESWVDGPDIVAMKVGEFCYNEANGK